MKLPNAMQHNVLQLEKVAAKVTAYFRQDITFLDRKDFQLPENQQFFLGAVMCRILKIKPHFET